MVAIETQASNLRRLKALYIDCGEKDQFNLLYGARRFVRRLNELGIAHRYEEFLTTTPVSITGWTRACLSRPGAVRLMSAFAELFGHVRTECVGQRMRRPRSSGWKMNYGNAACHLERSNYVLGEYRG